MNSEELAEKWMYLIVTKPDEYMWTVFVVMEMIAFEQVWGRKPTIDEIKGMVEKLKPKEGAKK